MDVSDLWQVPSIGEVTELLRDVGCRWWVSGGLALELHVGSSWRGHGDFDIGVCRRDAPMLLEHLHGWEHVIASRGKLRRWGGGPLSAELDEDNVWCRRPGGPWQIDVTIGEGDDDRWTFRRSTTFSLPWDRAVLHDRDGVPYLAPALQLLFKSKDPRPKDTVDAEHVIPMLEAGSLALLDARLRGHSWRAVVEHHRRPFSASDVGEVVALLERAGITVWVDGGWAVDALVGAQTRDHADLDIAVPTRSFRNACDVLARVAFAVVIDDAPRNVVLADPVGRLVDLHSFDDNSAVVVGDDGIARHGGAGLAYEVGGFDGVGVVGDRSVRCINAETLVRYHSGYDVDEDDWHDVHQLHIVFGVAIPDDYARWRDA